MRRADEKPKEIPQSKPLEVGSKVEVSIPVLHEAANAMTHVAMEQQKMLAIFGEMMKSIGNTSKQIKVHSITRNKDGDMTGFTITRDA